MTTTLSCYKATLNSCGASSKIAHAADKSLERGAHPTHLVWTRHGLLGCPAKCRRGNVWHVKWGKRCLIVKLRNSSCYLCLACQGLPRGSQARWRSPSHAANVGKGEQPRYF